MTEAEWVRCTDLHRMLTYLQRRAKSDRKLRLFAVACCGRIAAWITDPRSVASVQVAEQYADGLATEAQRATAAREARQANARFLTNPPAAGEGARQEACCAASATTITRALLAARRACEYAAEAARRATMKDRQKHLAGLLRDIFGNPFRPVALNPSWLTWRDGLVLSMARGMYEARDFADMPILADALEEAGCTNADILDHCRKPGQHVRGCWVVDALLGDLS